MIDWLINWLIGIEMPEMKVKCSLLYFSIYQYMLFDVCLMCMWTLWWTLGRAVAALLQLATLRSKWPGLSPGSVPNEVAGSIPNPGPFCVEFACSVWLFSCSVRAPQPPPTDSKLSKIQSDHWSRMSCCLRSITARRGSSRPCDPEGRRSSYWQRMDGWMTNPFITVLKC